MNIGVGALIVLINLVCLIKNRNTGILLFVVLSTVSPVYYINSIALSYNYLFLPILFVWSLGSGSINIKRTSKFVCWLFMYWIWFLCMTIVSAVDNGEVTIFPLIGALKYIIFFEILSKEDVIYSRYCDILRIIIFINCIAMVIEFLMMQIFSMHRVIEIWIRLFTTLGSSGSLKQMLESGSIGRLYGTFPSSAFPATISVLGIGVFLNEYSISKEWKPVWSIIGCIFMGFASSSKRFFLGSVLIVFVFYILKPLFNRDSFNYKKKRSFKFIFLVFGVTVGIYSVYILFKDILYIDYYIDFLLCGKFMESFSTRFGPDGVVNSMIPIIKEHIFTGVGNLILPGVNVTDSMFYVTLYKAGIIGLICFGLLFLNLVTRVFRTRSMYLLLTVGIIMFEFIISTEFFSMVGIIMLSYAAHRTHLSGVIENKSIN